MQYVTSAVFHGLLLSHHGSKLLGCLGGPLLERHVVSPSASISTLSPRDAALPLSLVHSLISLHGSSRESSQPSLLLPPSTSKSIPAATGPGMVGEFGSSSPDWWTTCRTLSEQDGRCAGCGPQIVTFACFIRLWLMGLSSSWDEVPRHSSRSHLLSSRDAGTPRRAQNCVSKRGTGWSTNLSDTSDLEFQQAAVKWRDVQMGPLNTAASLRLSWGFPP